VKRGKLSVRTQALLAEGKTSLLASEEGLAFLKGLFLRALEMLGII
jgi:hypothetical protein